jgi:GT2 family glycosyltransferase
MSRRQRSSGAPLASVPAYEIFHLLCVTGRSRLDSRADVSGSRPVGRWRLECGGDDANQRR